MVAEFELIAIGGVDEIKAFLKSPSGKDESFSAQISDQLDKKAMRDYWNGKATVKRLARVAFTRKASNGNPIDGMIHKFREA